MIRQINEGDLEQEAQTMLRAAERGWAYAKFMEWVRRQPEGGIPTLVGATAAAKILGIPAPHISRMRQQGRMPAAIPVEGGYAVYARNEVEALANELRAEREARHAARSVSQTDVENSADPAESVSPQV